MLYDEVGKPMSADPYNLDGWPRHQAKLALLIVINAPSHTKAVQALADSLRLEGGVGNPYEAAQALVRAIKAKHPDIAHAFGADAGIRLMRKDSEIAERVMLEMLRATGVVPLCVHDSFIVPANHKEELKQAMQDAFPTCQTKVSVSNFSCQTESEIRDSFNPESSKTSQVSVLQYGAQGSGCGGVASDLVALIVWRARLENLSARLARFNPHIVVSPSAGGSEFTSAKF
jgi:hypothetical protein